MIASLTHLRYVRTTDCTQQNPARRELLFRSYERNLEAQAPIRPEWRTPNATVQPNIIIWATAAGRNPLPRLAGSKTLPCSK